MSSFLDNSGDIILDSVLTDEGRRRLARDDGSFSIVKFALADDEIDYNKYDAKHSSGSAWSDIEIMKTPVMESITDNRSAMKNKLITYSRDDLLFLPVIKLNKNANKLRDSGPAQGRYVVAVDSDTEDEFQPENGVIFGHSTPDDGVFIRLDQGLDTDDVHPQRDLDAEKTETQYLIELDNRFGSIVPSGGGEPAQVSFVDDDDIASYFLSMNNSNFVQENDSEDRNETQVISGPRGTIIRFSIQASIDLSTSDNLFDKFGGASTMTNKDGNNVDVKHIDTNLRVQGGSTGA